MSFQQRCLRLPLLSVRNSSFAVAQVTFDTPAVDIRWAGEKDDSDKVGTLAEVSVALQMAEAHYCACEQTVCL